MKSLRRQGRSYGIRDGWTADKKDEVLVRLVCAGELPLNGGREAVARDWEQAS